VEVIEPGATLKAGELISIAAGFSASADLTLEIDPVLTPFAWLREASPTAETSYNAEFDLRLDGLTLSTGDRLEAMVARSATGAVTFRLVLQADGVGGNEALLEARQDDGSFVVTLPGQETAISAGWHRLRIEWLAGAGTGSLAIFLDGSASDQLAALANQNRRVDFVDWGVVGGVLSGASGSVDLDGFASWQ
jgi:hypothetical protein